MEEEVETVTDILFLGSKITVSSECSHEIKRRLPWKHYDKPRQHIKNQRHYFADKSLYSQSYGFFNSHVQIWELDHKEGWVPKELMLLNWGVREDSWESLGLIKPVSPKGNQPWIFFGRPDAEAEAPILWSPNVTSQTYWKRLWCWERQRSWEEEGNRSEVFGWHHQLSGHESEQTHGRYWWTEKPGVLQLWGHRKSQTWADWTTTVTEYNMLTFV